MTPDSKNNLITKKNFKRIFEKNYFVSQKLTKILTTKNNVIILVFLEYTNQFCKKNYFLSINKMAVSAARAEYIFKILVIGK